MKKFAIAISILLAFTLKGTAQLVSEQDKLALLMPERDTYSTNAIGSYVKKNFTTDLERVRALFVWVANNISYDVEKVRTKSLEPTTIDKVLNTKKAVGQGYAELFVALTKECDIRSIVIGGYSKRFDGMVSDLPHAWVATELNGKWYLFDPTWAAGSVKDYQFTRKFSNKYYKVTPEEMIKDHMPFDPMYQFLDQPLTYEEFNKGNRIAKTTKPHFNYTDSINVYNKSDTLNQLISVARRVNSNGERNAMISEFLNVLNKNQETYKKNVEGHNSKLGYDGAVAEFRKATNIYNEYISHKNRRFSSIKENKEIQQMIDGIFKHLEEAKTLIKPVVPATDDHRQALNMFNNNFDKFYARVSDENAFLKSYFAKRQSAQK